MPLLAVRAVFRIMIKLLAFHTENELAGLHYPHIPWLMGL